ncbi:MAG TPA: VOC family protein [Candidimonas sp.]|nr:VOC family protein [Candidimonas sp.]
MKTLINIDVPELGPAIDFYCAALPFTLNRTIDGDVAELSGGSTTMYLLRQGAGTRPVKSLAEVRRYARHWTPVHVDFVVDDVEQAAQRARNAGAVRESECVQWRGSKCISFADPFGHGFCLIEFDEATYS